MSELAHPPVHGLFQQRVEGDDALLRLAQLRFAQAGMAAEVFARSPAELEHVLEYVDGQQRRPVVHLDRHLDILKQPDQAAVIEFGTRFAGRVSGLVVHDTREMLHRTNEVVRALAALNSAIDVGANPPTLFVEYAVGLDLEWFVDLGRRVRDLNRVSLCIDIGHIGIRQAHTSFHRANPGSILSAQILHDSRAQDRIADVQVAVESALPAVVELTRSLVTIEKPLHFHLHDGHPLFPGLPDHLSFFTRLPIPFTYSGRRSLSPLYGPSGLASIVSAAISASRADVSFTLEIHQAEGRLPLHDAADLFQHWPDITNAERMNYLLSVLAENNILMTDILQRVLVPDAVPSAGTRPEDGLG